jgi:hypothetical protein
VLSRPASRAFVKLEPLLKLIRGLSFRATIQSFDTKKLSQLKTEKEKQLKVYDLLRM